MICPSCRGSGKWHAGTLAGRPVIYPQIPCHECGGGGVAYCCTGEDRDFACADKKAMNWLDRVLDEAARKVAEWPVAKRESLKAQINQPNPRPHGSLRDPTP